MVLLLWTETCFAKFNERQVNLSTAKFIREMGYRKKKKPGKIRATEIKMAINT